MEKASGSLKHLAVPSVSPVALVAPRGGMRRYPFSDGERATVPEKVNVETQTTTDRQGRARGT